MKLSYFVLFVFLFEHLIYSQNLQKPSNFEIQTCPLWAQKMYDDNPNVWEVDELFNNYYKVNPFVKSYHTQYYKRWKKQNINKINHEGYIVSYPIIKKKFNQTNSLRNTSWSLVGPIQNFQESGQQGSGQSNVYSLDQCKSDMNILYCGTEPGEVYKSEDGGENWFIVSLNEDFGSGVTAVEVSPTNPNLVFAGGNNGIFRSIDGGLNWENVLVNSNFGVNEILINSGNENIVFAATDKGLFQSLDGGLNWNEINNRKAYDIKEKTDNSSIIFCLQNNPTLSICEFYKSEDSGSSWNIQSSGWYSSNDPARNDGGGRLAVTPADPNRVYAYLIGESKADDFGFIGVFKSDDAGGSWSLPNAPTGGPYTTEHPNLAIGSPDWTYHQGFYNCAILCSENNPDEIIVGGLNIWKSSDGGITFQGVSGYIGGPLSLHVDNQDFRVIDGQYWFTTDGGIYHSTNLLEIQPDFKMKGINSSDFWGFGSGWNDDVVVGGLYHNGNIAHFSNYGQGNFLELGGGEAPTGYVNPGNSLKTYFSDIGGKVLPFNLNDPILSFGFGMSPNESYWAAESSEMEFHPNCYNIAYLGNENKLWKTIDGGATFNLLYTFGINTNNQVKYIEISSDNPDIIYLNQQPSSGNTGSLWKSIDGGISWTSITLPSGQSRRILLSVNPSNANELYIAFPDVYDGNKVFKTTNGGTSWTIYSDETLNGENIQAIQYIAGTNGGVYVGTNTNIFYRNENMSWVLDNQNLPKYTSVNIIKPFYKEGKIRIATYGKGIWEGNLFDNNSLPIARIMVNSLEQNSFCKIDSFYFDDYSFLKHIGATWEWTFPTGSPSSSNLRNPSVLFTQEGTHLAILKITNQAGQFDYDTITVNLNFTNSASQIEEGFENDFLPTGWQQGENNTGFWSVSENVGGYGTSQKSALFDNYNIYGEGDKNDLIVNLSLPTETDVEINFDVAYARWGGANSDTLEILYTNNCGQSYTNAYLKGGTDLATSPDFQEYFVPTSSQWRTETINLDHIEGNVQILFRNIGRYGNVLYLDNINITNSLKINKTLKSLNPTIFPNPICSGNWLNINNINDNNLKIRLLDINGKVLYQQNKVLNGINIPKNIKSGTYLLNLQSEKTIWNYKLLIEN
ncbi:MAG: T9SS type A sorting domain-containing protein [Flavobacteriia bacterium]|nr:T9SS type A sorting domain-containing protein [Flavobacteriia bacterium]